MWVMMEDDEEEKYDDNYVPPEYGDAATGEAAEDQEEPDDHPHGGGEGKSPVGLPAPVTPWGKPALGLKTRKHKKYSNKMIVKRAGK